MEEYWSLPQKPTKKCFMDVRNIGITFPMQGFSVRPDGDAEDERVITSSSGKMRGFRALQDISFSLKEGYRLAIIGRNGSGKTTLLQVLAGILTPDTGQIAYRGRLTSLININLGLQPEATGHRNITLRGLAAGYSRNQINEKREQIAAFSELHNFLNMPIFTYSAGMRMRLVFSIATAFEPEILILDEWLSAGDNDFKEKATQRMQGFVRQAGILVIASHNRKLLLENSDTALWLDRGHIRKVGPTRDVLEEYENQRPEGLKNIGDRIRIAASIQ